MAAHSMLPLENLSTAAVALVLAMGAHAGLADCSRRRAQFTKALVGT